MANTYDLVLLDCSSIQKYVFGSNRLKTNIGASYIVQIIYDEWIPRSLSSILGADYKQCVEIYQAWSSDDKIDKIALAEPEGEKFKWEVGYVGGGNALLLFRKDGNDSAQKFIEEWSRNLLIAAPGLVPASTVLPGIALNESGDISKENIDFLFEKLNLHKSRHIPQTTIARHGVTAECPYSGLSAELFDEKTQNWISSVSKAKIDMDDEADIELQRRFANELKYTQDGKEITYKFSNDSENLGQTKDDNNHIAIVHIDGNSMGKAFKNCKGLFERRKLSKQVDAATLNAMKTTIIKMIEKLPVLIKENVLHGTKTNSILPFRPIILNGDDITFICNAQLGFFLAETFMKAFSKQAIKLSSCAGIAIIKTKYPFYRGYQLAEQLCGEAKKQGRADSSNWLDFHIAYGGLSGTIENIRQQSYVIKDGSLLWRPWNVIEPDTMNSFYELKKAIKDIRYHKEKKKRWPNQKLAEFGKTLTFGKKETSMLLSIYRARGLELPPFTQLDELKTSGWYNKMTPYLDILEAIDFFPESLLNLEE